MNNVGYVSALPWLASGVLLALVELAALGSTSPRLVWTVMSLLGALGLIAGLVIAGTERLIRRLALPPAAAAAARAFPALVPFAFVAAHLFDGGAAGSLPGAAWGPLWLPPLAALALALALWPAALVCARPAGAWLAVAALAALTAGIERGNRTLFVSEYPDVHAFLILVAIVTLGAAIHLAARTLAAGAARGRVGRWLVIAAVPVVAVSLLLVLASGLEAAEDRWTVTTRGMHARQLVRLVRTALDRDSDGYAAVLGGGDCNDADAGVSPQADDIPGNGYDEDCDGLDAVAAPAGDGGGLGAEAGSRELPPDQLGPEAAALLARARTHHVLLLMVDALRADMLAPTQENRAAFPRLFELAESSRQFRRAFSTASGTDVALASLLTGRVAPFVPVETTLVEAMAATGRRTHAVIPREVLRWASTTLVTRGLGSYDRLITDGKKRDVGDRSTGSETTRLGLAFLDRHPGERLFLWLHYFDVHEHHQLELSDPRLRAALGSEQHTDRVAKYRASVRLVDAEIGRMMDELKRRGLWDSTIVVLVSDHGESLGEDPRLPHAHGRFLYNPLVHIPVLVRVPGVPAAAVDTPISLADVAPTLVALIGAEPLAGAEGRDLGPLVVGGLESALGGELGSEREGEPGAVTGSSAPAALASRAVPLVLNESDQHAVIDWPYKLLVRPQDNLIELFDIAADFGETRDLSAEKPDVVRRLTSLYKRFPRVVIDRSPAGRKAREDVARRPASRAVQETP